MKRFPSDIDSSEEPGTREPAWAVNLAACGRDVLIVACLFPMVVTWLCVGIEGWRREVDSLYLFGGKLPTMLLSVLLAMMAAILRGTTRRLESPLGSSVIFAGLGICVTTALARTRFSWAFADPGEPAGPALHSFLDLTTALRHGGAGLLLVPLWCLAGRLAVARRWCATGLPRALFAGAMVPLVVAVGMRLLLPSPGTYLRSLPVRSIPALRSPAVARGEGWSRSSATQASPVDGDERYRYQDPSLRLQARCGERSGCCLAGGSAPRSLLRGPCELPVDPLRPLVVRIDRRARIVWIEVVSEHARRPHRARIFVLGPGGRAVPADLSLVVHRLAPPWSWVAAMAFILLVAAVYGGGARRSTTAPSDPGPRPAVPRTSWRLSTASVLGLWLLGLSPGIVWIVWLAT